MLLSLLPILLLAASLSAVPAPVGPDLSSNTAAVAIAGLAVAAKLSEDECDDVGVSFYLIFDAISDYIVTDQR